MPLSVCSVCENCLLVGSAAGIELGLTLPPFQPVGGLIQRLV